MNHLKQIAARLPEYGLDAMLLNSEPGEYYAVGFHGEGNVVVTAQGCFYFTDSRYIEAANHLITCLLYTSPSPRDMRRSRMPSSA